MKRFRHCMVLLAFPLLSCGPVDEGSSIDLFSVEQYDPGRDPEKDLQMTIELAGRTGRRILLEVGGEWCSWCHAFDRFLQENPDIWEALARNFVLMKVNMSEENRNQDFLGRFPEISGYPHIFVLDGSGRLVHSQGTGELEEGRSYSKTAFMDFISRWKPENS